MLLAIILTIACVVAAIAFGWIVIGANRDYITHRTSLGWWVVGLGIIQVFCFTILTLWWPDWWIAHSMILIVSSIIAAVCLVFWALIEILRRL
jgi:hypothetical protein